MTTSVAWRLRVDHVAKDMIRILAIGAVWLVCTCCAAGAETADRQAPPPSPAEAEQLLLRADDIKRLSQAGTPGLTEVFRGRALQVLEAQAQALARRGQRVDERNAMRDLVHWNSNALEAVLQVAAQRRLVTSESPNPGWAATVRQWWVRFEFVAGRWWIADQRDLPPDEWRPVVTLTGWVHIDG